jgi:isopenicillin N synthase-like dioxygenase
MYAAISRQCAYQHCVHAFVPMVCSTPVVVSSTGALLLNLGSLMSRWTNGLWNSTLHRVTNPTPARARNSRRLSMAFFHKPNYDAVIEVGLRQQCC